MAPLSGGAKPAGREASENGLLQLGDAVAGESRNREQSEGALEEPRQVALVADVQRLLRSEFFASEHDLRL